MNNFIRKYGKSNKFGAKKTVFMGFTFDSKWESELLNTILNGWDLHTNKIKYVVEHTYTPDFINLDKRFIIETKGIRTPEFKMRFKLFLKYLYDTDQKLDVYVPSNQKEVDITVDTILGRGSFNKKKTKKK